MNFNCNVEEINKIKEGKMNLNLNLNTRKIKKIEKKGYGRVFYGYLCDDRLRLSDKMVYVYLCSLAGEKCRCFPKRKHICKDLHMTEKTLSLILKKLVDFGYITILKERKNGIGFQHNIYIIHGINDDIYMEIDTQKNSKFAPDDAKIESTDIYDYTLKEKNVNTYSEISEEKEEKNEHFEDENLQNSEQISDVSDGNDTYNVYEKENVDEIETYSGNQNQTYSGNQNQTYSGNQNQTYSGNQNQTTNNSNNNNIINNNKKKEIYIKKEIVDKVYKGKEPKKEQSTKKSKDQKIEMLISEYTSDCELKETLHDFLDMRKSMKKPMTFRAVKILLNKLDGIATETDKKIKVLERSILNGWQGIYEPKNDQWENKKNTHYASNEQKNKENDGGTTCIFGNPREEHEKSLKNLGSDGTEDEEYQIFLRNMEMEENKIPKHWKHWKPLKELLNETKI